MITIYMSARATPKSVIITYYVHIVLGQMAQTRLRSIRVWSLQVGPGAVTSRIKHRSKQSISTETSKTNDTPTKLVSPK